MANFLVSNRTRTTAEVVADRSTHVKAEIVVDKMPKTPLNAGQNSVDDDIRHVS